jgi:transcriptional regulator with XRE-family HTH domain
MPTIQELVGARVRELRKAKGWTLETWRRGRTSITPTSAALSVAFATSLLESFKTWPPLSACRSSSFSSFSSIRLKRSSNATADDILSAIDKGFRATIDAKGKLAEYFLFRDLAALQTAGNIADLVWFDEDGKPDFEFAFKGRRRRLECKNIRSPDEKRKNDGWRVELQETRNSKDGTPQRAYPVDHFDLLSVCLFNRAGKWEYLHISSHRLARRPDNKNLLVIMQAVPESGPSGHWKRDILEALSDREA